MDLFGIGQNLIQKALEDEKLKKLGEKVATRTSEVIGNTKLKDVVTKDTIAPASGLAAIGPGGQLIQGGPGSEMMKGSPLAMPLDQAVAATQPNTIDKIGATLRSPGIKGTDESPKGFGNDLYKFVQSIGYGMLDKPLGREANTWDYLGKTIGQIARLNEGSNLGAGQSIYEQPREQINQAVQLSTAKGENRLPTYAQSQEQLATVAALKSGKYALKGDFTGELARQDIKTFDDALTYVTYKGINPNDPTILEALKKYPVLKNGKVVGKFAGFDTDGEILVE
jgi:hypothetical protein